MPHDNCGTEDKGPEMVLGMPKLWLNVLNGTCKHNNVNEYGLATTINGEQLSLYSERLQLYRGGNREVTEGAGRWIKPMKGQVWWQCCLPPHPLPGPDLPSKISMDLSQ